MRIMLAVLLILLAGCAEVTPLPCACQQAIDDLTAQTKRYHLALKEKGLLSQSLQACEERRP